VDPRFADGGKLKLPDGLPDGAELGLTNCLLLEGKELELEEGWPVLGMLDGEEPGLLEGTPLGTGLPAVLLEGDTIGIPLEILLGEELGLLDGDADGLAEGGIEGEKPGDLDGLDLGAELATGLEDGALLG